MESVFSLNGIINNPGKFNQFIEIVVNVSEFFRDPSSINLWRTKVFPLKRRTKKVIKTLTTFLSRYMIINTQI
jgi:chemotaxis methyl-accepting protein methylase